MDFALLEKFYQREQITQLMLILDQIIDEYKDNADLGSYINFADKEKNSKFHT